MLVSFRSKETEQIWSGYRIQKMLIEIQKMGCRKLRKKNNSQNIADLRIPPSYRLSKELKIPQTQILKT